jgi:F0F1-type ATP synthase membrane subunit c/vacuolar-type H+-ATPase subunit K
LTIITAAFIEGVCLFAVVVCLLMALNLGDAVGT